VCLTSPSDKFRLGLPAAYSGGGDRAFHDDWFDIRLTEIHTTVLIQALIKVLSGSEMWRYMQKGKL